MIFWDTVYADIRWKLLKGTASSSPGLVQPPQLTACFLYFKELNDVLPFPLMPLMLRGQCKWAEKSSAPELLAPFQENVQQKISSCKFFLANVHLVNIFETLKLWFGLTDFNNILNNNIIIVINYYLKMQAKYYFVVLFREFKD